MRHASFVIIGWTGPSNLGVVGGLGRCIWDVEAASNIWFAAGEVPGGYPPRGPKSGYYLTPRHFSVNCPFAMATMAQFVPTEVPLDFDFPQREAAFFYGLFLRGHSAEQLRRDIEVPPSVLSNWPRETEREPALCVTFSR